MTDAKVLADALVEAGILVKDETIRPGRAWKYYLPDCPDLLYGCRAAITDWRVAGKVLESMSEEHMHEAFSTMIDYDLPGVEVQTLRNPRAIIEAWYAAVEGE